MEEFRKFVPISKRYFQYLLKLDFKEFFMNVVEFLLLVIVSCLVYVPIDMVKDILFKIITLFVRNDWFYNIYYLFFSIICACLAIYVFVRMFNKRYEDINEIRKNRKETIYKNEDNKKEKEKNKEEDLNRREKAMEEFELPKEFKTKNKK